MAKIVALSKAEAPAADERAGLHARREALKAEAARLAKAAEARAAVEGKLTELDAEQAAIDAADREAWVAWAETAEGPPPQARVAAREDIGRRRTLLAGDLTGALNGERAVQPRLTALNAELNEVGRAIYARLVDGVLDEAEEVNASVHAAAKAFVAVAEQADGLRDSIVEQLERSVVGGDRSREATLRAAFSRLERLEQPKMAGDANERARHARDYRRRLA